MYTEDKNEEKRNQSDKSKNKIVPIRFPYDESDDPVIDEFILRGLQEEADETERRMNADPELSKITAPDDQYDKIVARLKAMGVWQEEAGENSLDENTEEQNAAEDSDVNETDAASIDVADADVNETDVIDINANETDTKNKDAEDRVPVPDDPYQMLSEKDREAIELGRDV
ncbi:MAG: hypothetical protein LUH07_11255 [Lachnospiraceae bacterium]|nr:hypothetical protein [Lachnospiraceae bacterium]